jgi:hypothetical protein
MLCGVKGAIFIAAANHNNVLAQARWDNAHRILDFDCGIDSLMSDDF